MLYSGDDVEKVAGATGKDKKSPSEKQPKGICRKLDAAADSCSHVGSAIATATKRRIKHFIKVAAKSSEPVSLGSSPGPQLQ